MKPLATLNRPVLKTVDVVTKAETVSFKERTDVTAVPAMGVVAESMMALVLAGEALRKFGGDSVPEFVRNRDAYRSADLVTSMSSDDGLPARRPAPNRILLIGMMGAGKTTRRPAAGRPAAAGRSWTATPASRRRTGKTVPEIFAEAG